MNLIKIRANYLNLDHVVMIAREPGLKITFIMLNGTNLAVRNNEESPEFTKQDFECLEKALSNFAPGQFGTDPAPGSETSRIITNG